MTRVESFVPKGRNIAEHVCELPETSYSNLPRLPPNAKFVARAKRRLQKLVQVSERHPFTRFFLRSRAAVAFEKKRHGRSEYWWIVHPCSNFRFTWEIFMSATFLYLFVTIPYVNAFYRISGRRNVDKLYHLDLAYAVCILDIFMNFVTGYTSKDGHETFLDPLLIARHYSRRYFLIDFLTSVPYTWFASRDLAAPGPAANFSRVIVESAPLFKLLRMCTLRCYMKKFSRALGLSIVFDVGLWLSILTALIFHWSACATYGFPFFVLHATRTSIEDSDLYVVKSGLYRDAAISRVYLVSLHMGVSNLVGSSFIEFKKTSDSDKIIRCILLVFGTGYMIYLIVIVLQLSESLSKPELNYQEMMHETQEYIHDKQLPARLQRRLVEYYEYRFQGNFFKENAIFNTLSDHLRQEINVRLSHGLLETATIFHNLPRSLLSKVMASLKPVIYLQNDIIYKYNMDGDCMYFIASGTVALVNYLGKEICHLVDGNYFGETVLIYPERRRNVSAIALEVCEFLRLERADFKRLVTPETELYERLVSVAAERLEHTKRIDESSVRDEAARREKYDPRYSSILTRAENVRNHSSSSARKDEAIYQSSSRRRWDS